MLEQYMSDNADQEWQNFLANIDNYANAPIEKWNHYTLLSYFLVKYKEVNGVEFVFSYTKRGPTRSRELKQALKIWQLLDRGRLKQYITKEDKAAYKEQLIAVLKDYINWAFTKFNGKQTNITGLGIFAVPNFMNEFLQWRKINKTLLPKRTDPLPKQLTSWIETNYPKIWTKQQLSTLEDLNSLYNWIQEYDPLQTSTEAIIINKARELKIMPKEGLLEFRK